MAIKESEFVKRVLEAVSQQNEKVERDGREFTILPISRSEGFYICAITDPPTRGEAIVLKDSEYFDSILFLHQAEEFIYLIGNQNDFVYKVPITECPPLKPKCRSKQENTDTRRKAVHFSEQLPTLQVDELIVLAKILGVDIKRRMKGGAFEMLGKDELMQGIRSVLGRGTFPDRIERFNHKASEFFDDRVV